jgi:hypothetical protein
MTDQQIFKEAVPHSLMGAKLHHLIRAAKTCVKVPGMVAELGVYKGGSAMVLCRIFGPRPFAKPVLLIDTFRGMPCDDSMIPISGEGHVKGDFADTSAFKVNKLLVDKGIGNHCIIAGDFMDKEVQDECDGKYCFVHLDADIEQSTTAAISFFLPRLNVGGGFFFDDATSNKCAGVSLNIRKLMETGRFEEDRDHGTCFLKLKP